ncbi:asparagine synthase (glutamine-hydrolyzing) [Streptomyces sp. ODS28]|uniref:asparagine synthase (glutamine-hydrolyzing) n=1 Tax=Streptomyces sp. ODS28 TaxID=3136688 RepID=UPI0031E53158
MLDRLAHRGPDDSGALAVGPRSWLGHRRLSIVDLDGGRQPLTGGYGEGRDWALVCNGEIYNHAELRTELGEGRFASSSDSEAALVLLRERGPGALERLRGMWALCAATPDGRFVAARDRIGIKPLYWARTEDAVYFASELRAFDAELLPYAEIFPPGCHWTPEDGLRRFADPVPAPEDGVSWEDVPEETVEKATYEVVADSVRRHLMADVEVGVFLSGGLDSSLVAAVAADAYAERGRRLKTFAVGTEGSPDLLAARDAADFLGTEHHEALLDAGEAEAALGEVVACVESFDASLIRSAVPNWFLSRLAARHVKAVLTGEGADELFAGYGYYHRQHAEPGALDAELRRTIGSLHGLNLQRCDRVTMAHGLEARVPFLDAEVIGHAMSLPPECKALEQDGMEKGHLRRAFTGWLPDRLLWRRKEQFGTGSGAEGVLSPLWTARYTDAEYEAACAAPGAPDLRNKEELAYYEQFARALPGARPSHVLTRFATA